MLFRSTAKGSFDDMRQGFLSGSDDYMVKPVNVNEMVLRLRVRHCASRRSEAGSRLIETGRPRTCNISTEESYPRPSRSSTVGAARQVVCLAGRWEGTLPPQLETPSGKVSTGRRRWPTPLEMSAPAKGVSSTQDRPTCPLRPCRRYPSPGLLLCGVWTSSAPCRRHPRATCTCWSPSTILQVDRGLTPKQHQVQTGGGVLHQHHPSLWAF